MFTNEKEVIISEIAKTKANKVVELGFGMGMLTELIRKGLPDAFITAYDKNDKFKNKSRAIELADEIYFNDITKVSNNQNGTYDLVIMGAFEIPFWWKFNCFNLETYKQLIDSMKSFLKNDGKIMLILKNNKHNNQAQKSYNEALKVILHGNDSVTDFSSNENIIVDTEEVLCNLGFSQITNLTIRIKEEVSSSINCEEFLIKNNITDPLKQEKAKSIDANSSQSGFEFGYFSLITALDGK